MPTSTDFSPRVCYDLTATIAVNGTTSGAVDLAGCTLVGLFIPSTFDGTTLTITASTMLGGTYIPVPMITAAVATTLNKPSGTSPFHPRRIN